MDVTGTTQLPVAQAQEVAILDSSYSPTPPIQRGAGSCHLGLQIGSQIRPTSFMWVIVITSKGPLVSVCTVLRFNSWKYPTDHNVCLLPELLSLQQNEGHTSEHWKPSWWAGARYLFHFLCSGHISLSGLPHTLMPLIPLGLLLPKSEYPSLFLYIKNK